MRRKNDKQTYSYNWLVIDDGEARVYNTISDISERYPQINRNHINEHIVRFNRINLKHTRLPEHLQNLHIQRIDIQLIPNEDYLKQKHRCDCGGKYTTTNKLKHSKSKFHQEWLKKQNIET